MTSTAKDIGPAGWDQHSGAGIIQAKAAFDLVTRQANWSGWESRGGLLTSAPVAVSWGPNRLDVFAMGSDNAVWHRAYDGAGWQAWESLGGTRRLASGGSDPGAQLSGCVHQGRGQRHLAPRFNGSSWGAWESLGGLFTSAAPIAVSRGAGRLDVFARSGDDSVWHGGSDGSS